jgi:hypothetical protein
MTDPAQVAGGSITPVGGESKQSRLHLKRRPRSALALVLPAAVLIAAFGIPAGAASGTVLACPSTAGVAARTLPQFLPPLVSGDREFSDHGPAITVAAKLERWTTGSVDTLRVVASMRAEETQSNWTKAEGSASFLLYTAPAGCRIDAARLPGTFDSNGYLARTALANPYSLPAGNTGLNSSFVQSYRVWDDHSGLDIGSYTGVAVITKQFAVSFAGS